MRVILETMSEYYGDPGANQAQASGVNMLSFQPVPPGGHGPDVSQPGGMDFSSATALGGNLTSASSSASSLSSAAKGGKASRKRKSAPGGEGQQGNRKQTEALVRDFVSRVLQLQHDRFQDRDFAERALLNLARKVCQTQEGGLERWESAITGASSSCVCLPRPRDGRMTVAKSGSASTKKVFPQIVVCQVFRWPQIVFHNDIRSTANCSCPAAVKPAEGMVDDAALICINPHHYEVTPEAVARFAKASHRTAGGGGPLGGGGAGSSSSFSALLSTATEAALAKKKNKKNVGGGGGQKKRAAQASKPRVSVDEGFGDGEIHSFDSQGVDYLKIWNEKASGDFSSEVQEFDKEEILREIKFLSLESRQPCSDKVLEKIGVNELAKLLSGELVKPEPPKVTLRKIETLTEDPTGRGAASTAVSSDSEVEILPPTGVSKPGPHLKLKPEFQVGGGKNSSEESPASAVDDSAIQDLLDDIRGSFERQFDDEFEELTAAGREAAAAAAATGGAGGASGVVDGDIHVGVDDVDVPAIGNDDDDDDDLEGLESSLSMLDDFQIPAEATSAAEIPFQSGIHHGQPQPPPPQQHQHHPHGPSLVAPPDGQQGNDGNDGVPCIIDSWSVGPGTSGTHNSTTDFLAAAPPPPTGGGGYDQYYSPSSAGQQYAGYDGGVGQQMGAAAGYGIGLGGEQQQQQQQQHYMQQQQHPYYQQSHNYPHQ